MECMSIYTNSTCAVSSKMSSSSEEQGCDESELPSSSSPRILFTCSTVMFSWLVSVAHRSA